MMAYYYYDKNFDDKVECTESSGSGANKQLDESIYEEEESDSMFDKIFKKINI
ncbi:hypothetical protein IKI14_01320 [bacterium]|nr:hypothetical protein [bacterium]